jgi:hypothetical protein
VGSRAPPSPSSASFNVAIVARPSLRHAPFGGGSNPFRDCRGATGANVRLLGSIDEPWWPVLARQAPLRGSYTCARAPWSGGWAVLRQYFNVAADLQTMAPSLDAGPLAHARPTRPAANLPRLIPPLVTPCDTASMLNGYPLQRHHWPAPSTVDVKQIDDITTAILRFEQARDKVGWHEAARASGMG